MTASSASFRADLKAISEKLGIKAETVVRKLTMDAFTQIIKRSPVDTGRFRASWRYSVGSMDLSVAPSVDKKKGEVLYDKAPTMDPGNVRGELGNSYYITNALPYAEALEAGHSMQAPNGIVAVTVAEIELAVDSIVGGAK